MKYLPCILLLFVSLYPVSGIEPEPDWNQVYQEQIEQERLLFNAPKVGNRVSIIRRIGGETSGAIQAITDDTVKIGGKTYSAEQLTPETCAELFVSHYAANVAREKVLAQRDDYQQRKAEEEARIRLEAAQRAEQQRIADDRARREAVARQRAEESAYRASQPSNIEQQRNQQLAQRQQTEIAESSFAGLAGAMIVLVIVGSILAVLIYILPSIIAFKRGHHNAVAIFALNILLGWTFLGWVACLVWSLTQVKK